MPRGRCCVWCNKLLLQEWGKKFCSNACQGQQRSYLAVENWLAGGTAVKGVSLLMKKPVREWLLKKAGNECNKCGWNKPHPIDGRSLLHIHHIDGDARNSHPKNFEVLCPNCHSLTHNFGARNKHSFRKRKSYHRAYQDEPQSVGHKGKSKKPVRKARQR